MRCGVLETRALGGPIGIRARAVVVSPIVVTARSVARHSVVLYYRGIHQRLWEAMDGFCLDFGSAGQKAVGRTCDRHRSAVHGDPRCRDRERCAPVDQGRPWFLRSELAVGHHGLRHCLRRRAAPRGTARRHLRKASRVPRRYGAVHRELALVRARIVGGRADRVSRAAGARWRSAGSRRPSRYS